MRRDWRGLASASSAALLAAAIVPLSTAYSISETLGRGGRIATGVALAVIAVSVLALGTLAIS